MDVFERLVELVKPGDVLVPLCEEVVMPAAAAMEAVDCRGCRAAPRTVDRRLLRRSLRRRLNPSWSVAGGGEVAALSGLGPWYVKGPASARASGVRLMTRVADLGQLAAEVSDNPHMAYTVDFMTPDYTCIVEEAAPGPQYEISGLVTDRVELLTPTLVQRPGLNLTIEGYERYREASFYAHSELEVAALAAAEDLGLQWCIFCFELRRMPNGDVIVIDAHCRPGEEPEGEKGNAYGEAVGMDLMEGMLRLLVQRAGEGDSRCQDSSHPPEPSRKL